MKEQTELYKDLDITFSIPAYNDEYTIEHLVNECMEFAELHGFKYKFLLIDDGSTDKTKFILQKLEAKYDFIQTIYHPINLSFGPTLKEVFSYPKTEWICFLPGDHQFSAFDFLTPSMQYISEYDFILGKRVQRADSLYRSFLSSVYNFCISIIAHNKVSDVNSSVLFKSKILDEVTFHGKSAFVHAELYLNAFNQGYKIIEVPIKHKERAYGKAGGSKFKVMTATFIDVLSYVFRRRVILK